MSKSKRGENSSSSKLTWPTVEWIRDILGSEEYQEAKKKKIISQAKLSELFGISISQISVIKNNKTWRKND